MGAPFRLDKLQTLISEDPKFLFTLASYVVILAIYLNLNTLQSPLLGLPASILYFLVNGIFLGHTFFEKETAFLRLVLGILLLVMLLGFLGWLSVIIYNLDPERFILVLIAAGTLSSLLNKVVRN